MKIKQTKSSKKPRLLTRAVALLVTAVLVNAGFTYYLWRKDASNGNSQIANLIVRSVEALNQPVVIEPISGKAYIPIARLTLPPADNNVGQVVYRYDPGNGNTLPAELNLASKNNISRTEAAIIIAAQANSGGDPKNTFEKIPALQACARGVTINYQLRDGLKAAATKLLSNGKTAYLYTEPNCSNPELLNYAKQIDSY